MQLHFQHRMDKMEYMIDDDLEPGQVEGTVKSYWAIKSLCLVSNNHKGIQVCTKTDVFIVCH